MDSAKRFDQWVNVGVSQLVNHLERIEGNH
jgi:hypothetical protein